MRQEQKQRKEEEEEEKKKEKKQEKSQTSWIGSLPVCPALASSAAQIVLLHPRSMRQVNWQLSQH